MVASGAFESRALEGGSTRGRVLGIAWREDEMRKVARRVPLGRRAELERRTRAAGGRGPGGGKARARCGSYVRPRLPT